MRSAEVDSVDSPSVESSRVDDEFRALLEGVRTSLPGVQVLFAFLLTAPFQQRFADIDGVDRLAFAVAFVSSAVASVLLIAPSAHQRMRAPITGVPRRNHAHLLTAARLTIAGTIAMGVAIASTTLLALRQLYGGGVASAVAGVIAAITIWAWFYLPILAFSRRVSKPLQRHSTLPGDTRR